MEIRRLDLGPREARLQQVVLGEQVGILQPQTLLEPAAVGVGLYTDRGYALLEECVPQRETVVVCAMQLPALLTHIGNAECRDRSAFDADVAHGREREVFVGQRIRVVGDGLQRGTRVGAP